MSLQVETKDYKDYELHVKTKCPWIDTFLFEELITSENSIKNVITYSLEPAVPKGENCASEVIRAKVVYSNGSGSTKDINFIIKVRKFDVDESFKQNELFLREIAVYRDILPRAEELLRSINDDTKISAKCYLTDSERFCLIFEDLSATGYRNHDKAIGLTFDSYKSAFSILAKWHATTAVLFNSEPSIMKTFADPFYTVYQDIIHGSVTKSVARFGSMIKELENISKKIERISGLISLKINESLRISLDEFNCLNHNDLWINNIMFNGINNRVLLIDFQLAYLGSPGIDISKLLFKSSHNDIRKNEFDELLVHYYKELSCTLLKLEFRNVPTLSHIKQQMKIRGISSMSSALLGTISRYVDDIDLIYGEMFTCIPDVKIIDFSRFITDDAKDRLIFLIKYFEDLGYFDS